MKLLRDQGFALIEVLVAMTIMALVGLMAWRGMDALILGREVIDKRANHDAVYAQLINQFERDCHFILRAEVLGSNPLSAGAKNIWWVRQLHSDNRAAWMIVGYGITPAGLQRWTSAPLLRRTEAVALWTGVSRDPDLQSSAFRVSLTLPEVIRQTTLVKVAMAGGMGITSSALPNSSTLTSTTADADPNAYVSSTSASGSITPSVPLNLDTVTAAQRGMVMQWWLSDVSLPITRSCLMGGGL